jgi:hypothetical protein
MGHARHNFLETGIIAPLIDDYERVAEPRHHEAKILLDYWWHCVDALGDFAIGRDIPSRMIASLLRSIIVTEPVGGGADFRMRVAGTAVRHRFNGDIGGQMLSDLFPSDDFVHHLDASNEVLRTGKPIVLDSRLKRGAVEELHSEVVLLPVKSADRLHDWVLVGIFYFS